MFSRVGRSVGMRSFVRSVNTKSLSLARPAASFTPSPSFSSSLSSRFYSTAPFRSSNVLFNKIEFNWQDRLPVALPHVVAELKEASSYISDLNNAASSDIKVPSIDWASWEREITTPGVVAKLKAEFDSLKFDEKGVSEEDIKKQNVDFDAHIAKEEKKLEKQKKLEAKARQDLAKYEKAYATVGNRTEEEDYALLPPGVREENEKRFWDMDYVPDADEKKVIEADLRPIVDFFQKGGNLHEFPASLITQYPLYQKVGNYDAEEEWKNYVKEYCTDENGNVDPRVANVKRPKYHLPHDHHELLPLLAQRKAGAPVFGAPVPGEAEGDHH